MKKMASYFVFCLISVSLWGQSGLPIPRSFSTPVADLLPGYRPTSTLRTVQSRNFVELQLDSVITTIPDNNNRYVSARDLYTYIGDTVLVNSYSRLPTGEQTYTGYTKMVFNDSNVETYLESYLTQSSNLIAAWFYYNPVFPLALDSFRFYWTYTDGISDPSIFVVYTFVPGTSLVLTEQQKEIQNGNVLSIQNTFFEYDSQEREILRLAESSGSSDPAFAFSSRVRTEYFTDSSVVITDFQYPGSSNWKLGSKFENKLMPGTQLRVKSSVYTWTDSLAVPDWEHDVNIYNQYNPEGWETFYFYEWISDSAYYSNGTRTTYVQDGYIDSLVYFYLSPNGDSIAGPIYQYYYAMPSTTTQLNAKKAQVELAPNPAHAYLRARTEQNIQLAELYDLQGRLVMSIATDGTNVLHVHRNNLPSGIYTLRLRLENGTTVSERVRWE